jgi:hypothetical protein
MSRGDVVICATRLKLLHTVSSASKARSKAVMLISEYGSTRDRYDMTKAREEYEKSRREYDSAKAAFYAHCMQHGCW